MSFDKLVEKKIQEAMAKGEFDNLPGRGEPLDLSAYFDTPEDVRVGYSVLKNAGCIPEEVQLLKDAEQIKEKIARCADEAERKRLKKKLDETTLKLSLLMEHYKGKRRAR